MIEIKDCDFMSDQYGIEEYLRNWPMLYILEDGTHAYVGQTNSIVKRMNQHKESEEKTRFTKAHFIYYDKSNQSATFDYESRLIGLMSADGVFKLTNRNAGLIGLDYYDRKAYDSDFNDLWRKLQEKNLARKSIAELEQSDLFKYSPYKNLTDEQRAVVGEIVDSLRKGIERRIVIDGMPGSGKTIVAVYLMKLLRESPEFRSLKIGLVIPPTSLRTTMKMVFKTINSLSPKDVYGPSDIAGESFDILIVDESHRLKERKNLSNYSAYDQTCGKMGLPTTATQLDWITSSTKCSIFLYDTHQIVFPAGLNVTRLLFEKSFEGRMMAYYSMKSQIRCKAGDQYLKDLDALLSGTLKHKVSSENYELYSVADMETFQKLYRRKEQENGLTRMIAGYAWDWTSKGTTPDSGICDIEIEGVKLRWNSTTENWAHSRYAKDEVGCIHSIQGYDLNYGFVILGEDIRYDAEKNRVYADRTHYFDRYGKIGATDEDLDRYIRNIYYVLMTRGIKGTYLYICDPELREYFGRFVTEVSAESLV